MDQNLYPYYKRDVEAGILTDAEALELIECMWIKFGEQIWYWNEPRQRRTTPDSVRSRTSASAAWIWTGSMR